MTSSSVKELGLDNHEDAVSSTADSLPLTDTSSTKAGKDGRLPADDTLKPGSLTLGREKREIYISPQSKGFTLPRTAVDRSPTSATAPAAVKPLPKALQPKVPRDSSLQPLSPIQKANTGYSSLASGVNVTDSVLRQQRRHSSTEFATSPTAVSPTSRLLSSVLAKPEVVSERPEAEKGSSVGDRYALREPNPGLAKFPAAGQRPLFITEATKPRRPKPEVSSENQHRPKSTSFSDVLSFFESPSSTTSRVKPSYTPTSLMYSKFKMFTFDADERPSIVQEEEPIVNSTASNSASDPSPTISRLMRKLQNQNPSVGAGQRLFQTQASCPDPIPVTSRPVTQIRKSVASPTAREENSDGVSTTSTMSDPIELSPNSADNGLSPNMEFGVGLQEKMSDAHHDGTEMPGCEVEVWTKAVEEPVEKDADENEDEVTAAGTNDMLTSDDEVPPPPLPFFPPPLDFDVEDRYLEKNRLYLQLLLSIAVKLLV